MPCTRPMRKPQRKTHIKERGSEMAGDGLGLAVGCGLAWAWASPVPSSGYVPVGLTGSPLSAAMREVFANSRGDATTTPTKTAMPAMSTRAFSIKRSSAVSRTNARPRTSSVRAMPCRDSSCAQSETVAMEENVRSAPPASVVQRGIREALPRNSSRSPAALADARKVQMGSEMRTPWRLLR